MAPWLRALRIDRERTRPNQGNLYSESYQQRPRRRTHVDR